MQPMSYTKWRVYQSRKETLLNIQIYHQKKKKKKSLEISLYLAQLAHCSINWKLLTLEETRKETQILQMQNWTPISRTVTRADDLCLQNWLQEAKSLSPKYSIHVQPSGTCEHTDLSPAGKGKRGRKVAGQEKYWQWEKEGKKEYSQMQGRDNCCLSSIKKKSEREKLGKILRNGIRENLSHPLKRNTTSNNTKQKARDGTWQVEQWNEGIEHSFYMCFFIPQWGLQVKEEKYTQRPTFFFWWSNTTTSRPSEAKESWNLIQNIELTTSSERQLSIFLIFIFCLNCSTAKELIKSHFGIAE